ncbi:MAG: CHAT domain-containing protein [Bacteroidia bacterium]|nr:CHAT domain-containing protein [Bacteroidia bacterium]
MATHGFFYPEPEAIKKEEEKKKEVSETPLAFRGGTNGFGVWQFVMNKNPLMRSGLVFAGANNVWNQKYVGEGEDGVLTAQEVTQLDLQKTQLVVLSACETGLGDIKGSEGVYGLQRAFKMAGVKFLIMSLWQVPDKETSEFMTKFYDKLLTTKDIRKSFNETQSEMRKKYDPYYWAVFVLIE